MNLNKFANMLTALVMATSGFIPEHHGINILYTFLVSQRGFLSLPPSWQCINAHWLNHPRHKDSFDCVIYCRSLLIQMSSVPWRRGRCCSLLHWITITALLRQQSLYPCSRTPLWGIWDILTFCWPLKTFRQGAYWLSAMIYVGKDREEESRKGLDKWLI